MKTKVICAYPWVPSVQLLLWLVQVLFSHPLTFAFAPIHPAKTKEIFIKPERTSLERSSVHLCMQCILLDIALSPIINRLAKPI